MGEVEICQEDVIVVRVGVLNAKTQVGDGSRIGAAWSKALLFRADVFFLLLCNPLLG